MDSPATSEAPPDLIERTQNLDLSVDGSAEHDKAPDIAAPKDQTSDGKIPTHATQNQLTGPRGLPMVNVTRSDRIVEILTSQFHDGRMLFFVTLNDTANKACWIDMELMQHQADFLRKYWELTGNRNLPLWAQCSPEAKPAEDQNVNQDDVEDEKIGQEGGESMNTGADLDEADN